MFRSLIGLVVSITFVGCATVNSVQFKLGKLECDAVEVRPSLTSTISLATCLEDGKSLGLVSGQSMPTLSVILESGQIASSIGQTVAQGIIAAKIAKAVGKSVSSVSNDISTSIDSIGGSVGSIGSAIQQIPVPTVDLSGLVIPPAIITISPVVTFPTGP